MPDYTQKDRSISFKADTFGDDDLLLAEIVEGKEGVSNLFSYKLSILSKEEIEPADILGKAATISVKLPSGQTRCVNGIISLWTLKRACGPGLELCSYEATLSPRLWLASQCRNQRVFHNSKAIDAVTTILNEWDVLYDVTKLSDPAPEIEQIVQYGESDFAFVSRLLESIGVFYFFVHAKPDGSLGKHTMTLLNANPAYTEGSSPSIPYNAELPDTGLSSWESGEQLGASAAALTSYNFRDAGTPYASKFGSEQTSSSDVKAKLVMSGAESGWPNPTQSSDFQTTLNVVAASSAKAIRNSQFIWRGETGNRSLTPGMAFQLTGFPRAGSKARQALIRETVIQSKAAAYYLEDGMSQEQRQEAEKETFRCALSCSDLSVKFQVPFPTPRPMVASSEHGTVVTSAKYGLSPANIVSAGQDGRVMVELEWGRSSAAEQCVWSRVLHPRAGNAQGHFSLPEVGQEVLISFLGGDPDAPVATGSLHNSSNPQPADFTNSRGVYSSFLREATVNIKDATTAPTVNIRPPTGPTPGELTVADLADPSKLQGYNEVSFWNMHGVPSDEQQKEIDKKTDLAKKANIMSFFPFLANDASSIIKANIGARTPIGPNRPLEGINMYSNSCVLNQAAQDQVIKAGKNIVIEAGSSITLLVGHSQITISDSAIDIRNKNLTTLPLFDSSLTLKAWQASLNSALQTSVTGFVQAKMESFCGLASQSNLLFKSTTSAASVKQAATGIPGKALDKGLKSVGIILKLTSTIFSSAGSNTEGDTSTDMKYTAASINMAADAVALASLLMLIVKTLKEADTLLYISTSSVSMDGGKITVDTPNMNRAAAKAVEKADPVAGYHAAINGICSMGGAAGGAIAGLVAAAGNALIPKRTTSPLITEEEVVGQDTIVLGVDSGLRTERLEGEVAHNAVVGDETEEQMINADFPVTKTETSVLKTDSKATSIVVEGAAQIQSGVKSIVGGAESKSGAAVMETDVFKTE